jgi:hypothetical protein
VGEGVETEGRSAKYIIWMRASELSVTSTWAVQSVASAKEQSREAFARRLAPIDCHPLTQTISGDRKTAHRRHT